MKPWTWCEVVERSWPLAFQMIPSGNSGSMADVTSTAFSFGIYIMTRIHKKIRMLEGVFLVRVDFLL